MKNQNPLTKLTLLLAMLLTLGATQTQAKILPVSISFAPVGITMDQTERLNLVNMDVLNGMLIRRSFYRRQRCYACSIHAYPAIGQGRFGRFQAAP
jgi:hypothetical protein